MRLSVVPGPGIEPGHPCGWRILSPLRLPVPPSGLERVRSLRDEGARAESAWRWRQRKSPTSRSGLFWRPGSELNRRTRICSPLHNHSATRPVTGIRQTGFFHITAPFTRRGLKRQDPENGALSETGAGNETRTRDPDLGKVVLYQLSYSRRGTDILGMEWKVSTPFSLRGRSCQKTSRTGRPGCHLPIGSSNACAFAMCIFSMNARLRAIPAMQLEGTQNPTTTSAVQQQPATIHPSRTRSSRTTVPDTAGTPARPSARSS